MTYKANILRALVLLATLALFIGNSYATAIKLPAGEVKMVKERFTIVLLPPEEMALDIEAYARKNVAAYAAAPNGGTIYLLGVDPATGERRRAHCTVAQVEAELEPFEAHVLPALLKYLDTLHKEGLTITGTLTGVNFYPVPANSPAYTPVVDIPTTWFDRDVARGGGVLDFNNKVVRFLGQFYGIIDNVTVNGNVIAKTINGVGDAGYRPHFTLGRGVLPAGKAAVEMPAYTGIGSDLKPFPFKVAIGKSKPSGEFVDLWGYYNEEGQFVDLRASEQRARERLDAFDTIRYGAKAATAESKVSAAACSECGEERNEVEQKTSSTFRYAL